MPAFEHLMTKILGILPLFFLADCWTSLETPLKSLFIRNSSSTSLSGKTDSRIASIPKDSSPPSPYPSDDSAPVL